MEPEVLTPEEEALFNKLMKRIKAREVEGKEIDNLIMELLTAYTEAKSEITGLRGLMAAALREGPMRRILVGKKLFGR